MAKWYDIFFNKVSAYSKQQITVAAATAALSALLLYIVNKRRKARIALAEQQAADEKKRVAIAQLIEKIKEAECHRNIQQMAHHIEQLLALDEGNFFARQRKIFIVNSTSKTSTERKLKTIEVLEDLKAHARTDADKLMVQSLEAASAANIAQGIHITDEMLRLYPEDVDLLLEVISFYEATRNAVGCTFWLFFILVELFLAPKIF